MMSNLETSPMYNLSLNSLENFHSSFWKVISHFNGVSAKQFVELFVKNSPNINHDSQIIVEREYGLGGKLRADLAILVDDKPIMIVENKLKSFPRNEQLIEYKNAVNDKYNNVELVLTSLEERDKLPNGWINITYKDIVESLKKLQNNIDLHDEYHKGLLKDYIESLDELINQYHYKIKDHPSDKYNFCSIDHFDLKDIYVKNRAAKMLNYLETSLKSELIDNVRCGHSFYNKKACLDFNYSLGGNSFIGVQIEGAQYRYVLNLEKQNSKEISQKLAIKGLWFNDVSFENSNMRGLKNESLDKPVFCQYGSFFQYRYIDLRRIDKEKPRDLEELHYDEILKKLVEDMKALFVNIDEIKQLIK